MGLLEEMRLRYDDVAVWTGREPHSQLTLKRASGPMYIASLVSE